MTTTLTSSRFGRTGMMSAAALLLAVVLTASSGEWAPTALAILGLAAFCSGLGCAAWLGGWFVLPLVSVAVGETASWLFYDHQADVPPDNRVSGMDEIGMDPASVVILLPFVWVLLTVVLLARVGYRKHRGHAQVPAP